MRTDYEQFVDKAIADSVEREWISFLTDVVQPAFNRLKAEIFVDKYQPLTERTDPGFKLKDDPSSEFWFWITFKDRVPVANAARKFGTSSSLQKGTTPHLSTKPNFKISDVTVEDILNAVAYSYEKSQLTA